MKRSTEGSIYKSSDGRNWLARLRYTDANGKRREKKRTCKTHAIAKATVATLKQEIESDGDQNKTYRQLDQFFREKYLHPAKFVGGKKISGFKQNLKISEVYLNRLLEHFGDADLQAITFAAIEKFKRKLESTKTIHGNERSVSDVNQHLRRLRRLLNIAIEQDWLSVNPFTKGKGIVSTAAEIERMRILSTEEENRLIAACTGIREHIRAIVIFAIETAARRGEILAVTWFDVNFDARHIKVKNKSATVQSTRLVPITSRLQTELTKLRKNPTGSNIFNTGDFKKAWNTAKRNANLDDLHFHDLRHTAITRMLEKRISPPLVMKISGHTQYKTFLRYVNQSEESIAKVAELLDNAAA